MLILRVAVLNQADYEFEQHLPIALREGCSQDQVEGLKRGDFGALGAGERAAMRYCDEMTRDIRVRDATFAELRAAYGDREIVEISATVAAYNMVSRFLEASGSITNNGSSESRHTPMRRQACIASTDAGPPWPRSRWAWCSADRRTPPIRPGRCS